MPGYQSLADRLRRLNNRANPKNAVRNTRGRLGSNNRRNPAPPNEDPLPPHFSKKQQRRFNRQIEKGLSVVPQPLTYTPEGIPTADSPPNTVEETAANLFTGIPNIVLFGAIALSVFAYISKR